jgi:hypothetical protein
MEECGRWKATRLDGKVSSKTENVTAGYGDTAELFKEREREAK